MPTLTISKRTHEALREFNERQTGRGIDTTFTKDNGDGTVTIMVGEEVLARLAQINADPEEAILIALRGGNTVQ